MAIQKIIDKLFNNKIKEQVVKLSVGETIITSKIK